MKYAALSAVAAAVFAFAAAPSSASAAAAPAIALAQGSAEQGLLLQASSGDRKHFRHGDRHRRGAFHHRHRSGPHFGIYIGPRTYGYRSCAWLRHRAIQTGSRYWWRRYRECID